MKVTLVSAIVKNNNIKYNTRRMLRYMSSNKGSDLVCFPEAYLQGFYACNFDYKHDINLAVSLDSDIISKIKSRAKKMKTGVGFGYIENYQGRIYSSYILISKEGEILLNYRRISKGWRIADCDTTKYCEGDKIISINYLNKVVSIALCGDMFDDEILEKIKAINPHIVIWPVYVEYTKERWNSEEKNAYNNRTKLLVNTHVLYCNAIARKSGKKTLDYGGAIHYYNGVIAQLDMGTEGVLSVDIEE